MRTVPDSASSREEATLMPPEWAHHEATWLTWPRPGETWEGVFDRIPAVWVKAARALRDGETVRVLVGDAETENSIRSAFGGDLAGIELFRVPTNDAWIRDYGPLFAIRRGPEGDAHLVATCWGYNAWGGKYPPWDDDARVAGTIAKLVGTPRAEPPMVLEGGAVDVDGEGTILAARGSILSSTRNPGLDRGTIEGHFARHLGARVVHWFDCALEGDDTDGHVDNSVRFVAPGMVVAAVEGDPRDANHRALRAQRERLEDLTDAEGRRLTVVELPMPEPVVLRGQRCPASYVNFYIGNAVVLVPTFGHPRDAEVLGILGELLPDRRAVGIDCRDLVWGLGGLHCVTQQQPAR